MATPPVTPPDLGSEEGVDARAPGAPGSGDGSTRRSSGRSTADMGGDAVDEVGRLIDPILAAAKHLTGIDKTMIGSLGIDKSLVTALAPVLGNMAKVFLAPVDFMTDLIPEFVKNIVSAITAPLGEIGKGMLGGVTALVSNLMNIASKAAEPYEEIRKKILITAQRTNETYANLLDDFNKQNYHSMGILRRDLMTEYAELSEKLSIRFESDSHIKLKSIAVLSQKLKKIGIENTGELLQTMNTQFSMTVGDFDKLSRQLVFYSEKTGQSYKSVFKDYQSFAEKFAVELNSDKIRESFSSFQLMTKKTGIGMETLLGFADKFDSLDEGMAFGSNLNVVLSSLGSSFDSVLATTMDYPERMKYVVDQIAASKGAIDGLSIQAQRSVVKQLSKTAGIAAGDIRKILNGVAGDKLNIDKMFQDSKEGTKYDKEMTDVQLEERLADLPKDFQKMWEDNVPSTLIAFIASFRKVIGEADNRVVTDISRIVDNNYHKNAAKNAVANYRSAVDIAEDNKTKDLSDFMGMIGRLKDKGTEVFKNLDNLQKNKIPEPKSPIRDKSTSVLETDHVAKADRKEEMRDIAKLFESPAIKFDSASKVFSAAVSMLAKAVEGLTGKSVASSFDKSVREVIG